MTTTEQNELRKTFHFYLADKSFRSTVQVWRSDGQSVGPHAVLLLPHRRHKLLGKLPVSVMHDDVRLLLASVRSAVDESLCLFTNPLRIGMQGRWRNVNLSRIHAEEYK